ncbi:TMEM175 family protein [Micromonospora sp. NPDC047465]|uniref:TMEM175 family protein n=1 Tax=Micromonospora sp. NPDC047465 TaxID=3154813 RepID=UPI0033C609EB
MERGGGRAEAFSDTVIAIVLTLMAIELLRRQEEGGDELGASLLRGWPAYLAYAITFTIVGQVWLTHHNMWRYVERGCPTLVPRRQ